MVFRAFSSVKVPTPLPFPPGKALAGLGDMMRLTYPFAAGLALGLLGCQSGSGIPHGTTSTDETALATYPSCAALETDLRAMVTEEVAASFDQMRNGRYYPLGVSGGPPSAEGDATGAPRQEGVDYSGTNNQEAGVDEADFVKTDGFHIYVVNGVELRIFGVPAFGQLVPQSKTEIEGYPTEMLLDKDAARVAVFSNIVPSTLPVAHPLRGEAAIAGPAGPSFRVQSLAKITVLDVSDPVHPALVREVYLEGSYGTARFIDGSVRMAGFTWLDFPVVDAWVSGYSPSGPIDLSLDEREARARAAVADLSLAELTPRIYERLPDKSFHTFSMTDSDCRWFHRPSDSHGRGVTSILTLDLRADDFHLDADEIVSNAAIVYASTDDLYIVESANDWWWYWWNPSDLEKTNIHQFDIRTAGATHYVASGRVRGSVRDSFSLSENDGDLRVVTTTNADRWWWAVDAVTSPTGGGSSSTDVAPQPETHIVVMAPSGGRLRTIGKLDGIAPGEHLFASRLIGDRGYVVTARFIDPLFTFDLSDPTAPRLLGELKVPGVSTYVQRISDGRLLTIGWGASSESTIDESRTQVSLFDVADEAHPALVDTQALAPENGWSTSQAAFEHRAFQYWAPAKLLAVPVSSYQPDGSGYGYGYASQLRLIQVDDGGLSIYGSIDHSRFYNADPSIYWQNTDIERSIFMGDFIYAVSDRGITANRIADLAEVAAEPLDGYRPDVIYWAF